MPPFNVGDEFEFTGMGADRCARIYSPNGRTYIISRIEESGFGWAPFRRLYFIDKDGRDGFFYENSEVRLVHPAGPPTTVRAMSNKVWQEYQHARV